MAGEWRRSKLNQLGRIVTGKTPPSSRPGAFGGDIPFVTPTDFDGRRFIGATGRFLTEGGASLLSGYRIPGRAVMVSCIGSDMGKAAIAARQCVTNQQINSVIVGPDADDLFVYYNLRGRKKAIRSAASGSAQPILNKSDFGEFEIFLPPIGEQRAIARILGSLDDKIELNRRMCETLEAMARALFKSWFIDFDPVRAKAEGRDSGLSHDIATLFPSSFNQSVCGEIPKTWAMGAFAMVAQLIRVNVKPFELPDREYLHFSIPAFDDGKNPRCEKGAQIKSGKFSVPPGCILLSKLNPEIDRTWLVDVSVDDAICSTEFLVLRPSDGIGRAYLYCALKSRDVRDKIESLVTGTSKSHQRAHSGPILNLPVIVPPLVVVQAFRRIADPMFARILEIQRESATLGAIRDALLPKLMSGEIPIKDAERFLEATAA